MTNAEFLQLFAPAERKKQKNQRFISVTFDLFSLRPNHNFFGVFSASLMRKEWTILTLSRDRFGL